MAKITHKKMMVAIKDSSGIISTIASRLNVTRQTVYSYLENDKEAQEAIEAECETVLDTAENVILEAIKDGDIQTAKWYLGTKGGKRGYNPALELRGSQTEPITINFIDKESSFNENLS